jgi:MoaA/NifB/PqqE/SkfB family radical SAM enzyme
MPASVHGRNIRKYSDSASLIQQNAGDELMVSNSGVVKDGRKMLIVELGDACNNNCIFCSVKGKDNRNLTTDNVKGLITRSKESGFNEIDFLGGEPTIRGDIVELVGFAREVGFNRISMTTNGRMLSYENFSKGIIDAGCSLFAISLYGHKSSVHDACTRTPGSFDQTVKGIGNVLRSGVDVQVNFVMNSINIKHLEEFIGFINSRFPGVKKIHLINMNPVGEAVGRDFLIFRFRDYRESIDRAIRGSAIKIKLLDVPLCFVESRHAIERKGGFYVHSHADPSGCERKVESGLDHIISKPEICSRCSLRWTCIGVTNAYLKIYGSEELKPI